MTITDITSEGNGVGKADGFVIFVPDSAIGDDLQVRIVKLQKNFAYGIIEEIVTPSSDRILPNCSVYSKCGGCSLRHISYEAELALKENWVKQHLLRIGGLNIPILPIIGSPQQDGYRNKGQCPVRSDGGAVFVGMFSKRSHRIIPCTGCKLQPAHFEAILKIVQNFCEKLSISIYNEEKRTGLLRHVYIRHAEATNETMVCLVINGSELPHSDILIEQLCAQCPSVKSLVLNINNATTNVILGKTCKVLWGSERINDVLCGVKISLSPLSFYQVNHAGAEKLYNVVAEFAELCGNEVLLDLYCGAGTIGLSLAHRIKTLIGVEITPQAVEDATANAAANGITNAVFLCDDATGAAQRLHAEGLTPNVVVLDPPRRGCEAEVLSAVAEMHPQRIVMVSCNSATLARDLAVLETYGYSTIKAQPLDMFPRTGHVECVALLCLK